MSDVKRCPCRGSNEMCGCQNGPHPVRQDPEAEITALRARLEEVEAQLAEEQRISTLRGNMIEFELTPALHDAEAALATARRDVLLEAVEKVESLWAYRTCAEVADAIRALANEAET